ncbi:MAG: GntR family transcriptional regulator [Variovorax paradoxus]|jgi:DNA-binding transcriptional MocR family regulator|nr:MAG: GntR family transcriptional regulator [Variovorax paradoxus]PZQ02236.1 MAG: GntR family transcriptional regulator [Variovorax paradoxus]
MPPTESIFVQLADALERQILEGAFRAGDKLPSLRALAGQRGLGKNTVVAAFELLVARGLVEPRRGAGFFVKVPTRASAAAAEDDAGSLGRAMGIVWLMRNQLREEPGQLNVGDGFPPIEWLAGARLDRHHHKVARGGLGTLFRYGNRFGYEPLRQRLVRRLADFGIAAGTRQTVLTHGANEAMDIIVRYFVPPGAVVLADDPGYYPLFGKLHLAGARTVGVPRTPDGPDPQALEQLLLRHRPRVFFTQSLAHNPTGSDLAPAVAQRVLALARQHNLLIVENDPLADFKPPQSTRLAALDGLERTLYVGSFSKSLSAALRVGFIACSADLASDLADLKALVHVSSSEYCERTVETLLGERQYLAHLAHLRRRVTEATLRAQELLQGLGAELFAQTPASLFLWARLPGAPDALALAQAMLERQVMMAPGRIFSVDPEAVSPWSRFNVGAVLDPRFAPALRAVLRRGARPLSAAS